MRSCLTIELKRALASKGMAVSALFGLAVVAYYAWVDLAEYAGSTAAFAKEAALYSSMNFGADLIWPHWMPMDPFSLHGYLLVLTLPLTAGLPHAGSLFRDRADGYVRVVCTRVSRGVYLLSKWIATFISGGVVAVVPMLAALAYALTRYPFIAPIVGSGHHVAGPGILFAELFMTHPGAWIMLCMALLFTAGGLLASLGLAVTFITDHAVVVHLLPMLLLYVIEMLLVALGQGAFGPFTLIDPARNVHSPLIALVILLAVLAAASAIPLIRAARTELS